jgi:hypothetical protein
MESELEHQLRELIDDPKPHNDDVARAEPLLVDEGWSPAPWHRDQWQAAAINSLAELEIIEPLPLTRRRAA